MRRGRAFTLLVGLGAVGAGSWGLYYTGHLGAAAALRLGSGLCAGLVLLAVLPALWPPIARRSALEEVVDSPPPAGPERPRSLRDIEMTLRLACSKRGGRDVYYRLRPELGRIALHRLRARGVASLDSVEARQLLGEDLWELLRPDAEPPEQEASRPLAASALERWVERVDSL